MQLYDKMSTFAVMIFFWYCFCDMLLRLHKKAAAVPYRNALFAADVKLNIE